MARYAQRLENGQWHTQETPEHRQTLRHSWARIVEQTDFDDDQMTHPYTNWGFDNRLEWALQGKDGKA